MTGAKRSAAIKPASAPVIGCDVYTVESLEDMSHQAPLWCLTEEHPLRTVNKSRIWKLSQAERYFNTFYGDIINYT